MLKYIMNMFYNHRNINHKFPKWKCFFKHCLCHWREFAEVNCMYANDSCICSDVCVRYEDAEIEAVEMILPHNSTYCRHRQNYLSNQNVDRCNLRIFLWTVSIVLMNQFLLHWLVTSKIIILVVYFMFEWI